MNRARYSGIPGREARAASVIFPPIYVFIPLFIILAAACLLLAGCTDDVIVSPDDGNGPDDPVCPAGGPWVEITAPFTEIGEFYPSRFEFRWEQDQAQAIAYTRYFLTMLPAGENATGIMNTLNSAPEELEDLWSDWEEWGAEGGRFLAGEEAPLFSYKSYLFVVQAKDSCGNVTDSFELSRNAREFHVRSYSPPLVIWEPMLGTGTFVGIYGSVRPAVQVFPDIEFSFRWNAENAYSWFGPIQYRYGWDIQNLGDDGEWTFPWSSQIKQSFPRSFNSGVHTFYAEARDEAGTVTRARVEIEVIPYTRGRDLLWIDDYPLGGYIISMTDPSEEVHDAFWTNICSTVPGFDPAVDIFEAREEAPEEPLPLSALADYKFVVWTYNTSITTTWQQTVVSSTGRFRVNSLKMFLAKGGHALTCGRADRRGGMYEVFPIDVEIPASVTEELYPPDYGPEIAEYSFARDEYYITVIDKVTGYFKSGEEMVPGVNRSIERDALMRVIEAGDATDLDFPDTLALDDIVTCQTCFFNPQIRGFTYVEVYDPEYYMDFIGAASHPCFTPIYRMRSRSTISPLDDQVIAVRGMLGGGPGSCEPNLLSPYESYHFGFPLWFMDHEKVEQITGEIFRSWDIR